VAVRGWVLTALRIGLAAVLAYAGAAKIGDPSASVRAVRAYQLLPDVLERGVGYGLPFLELALAVLLLVGLAVRIAASVSAVLFALFLAGIVSVAARGLRIECGCFGGGGQLAAGRSSGYTGDILRDVLLLLVAVALAVWPATRFALDDAVRSSAAAVVPDVRVGPRRTAEARRRQAELAHAREVAGQRRAAIAGVLAAVLLVLATGAGIGVQAARLAGANGPSPQAVSLADGVQFGRSGARVTIELYEDPQCPVCANFEQQAGAQLQSWMKSSTARVKYYVLSLLDGQSSTKYSSRAASALYCSADAGVFQQYHDLLFANQPAEGSAGLTDDQLIAYGTQAGIAAGAAQTTFSQCVTTKKYADFVTKITDTANQGGILATPTILVDGQPVQDVTLAGVTAAVDTAVQSG
jgi:protein-disulfide isomerase